MSNFVLHKYTISLEIGKIRKVRIFLAADIFYLQDFFLCKYVILLNIRKIRNISWGNVNFPCECFLNAPFFSINMQLFNRKLTNFMTNCQNMNFSQSWYFVNAHFFFHKCTINLSKWAKFVNNCQNMNFFGGWL